MAGFSRLSGSIIVTDYKAAVLTGVTAQPLFVAPRQLTLRSASVHSTTAPTGTAEVHSILVDGVEAVALSRATTVADATDYSLNVTVPAGGVITLTETPGGTSDSEQTVVTLELD